MEEWREIFGGPYEVSSFGRVRKAKMVNGAVEYRILSQKYIPSGSGGTYFGVALRLNGETRQFRVHRLIALAFIGEGSPGWFVNHRDGNPRNNHISNLEYVTPRENSIHASNLGLLVRGEKHGYAKLTEAQVKEIRHRYYGLNHTLAQMVNDYGVNKSSLHSIIHFKSWNHVPSRYRPLANINFGALKKGKITEYEVREVRRLVSEGVSYRKIQEQFGINPSTINALITGKTWKHVK
jgi:hypothetical protein